MDDSQTGVVAVTRRNNDIDGASASEGSMCRMPAKQVKRRNTFPVHAPAQDRTKFCARSNTSVVRTTPRR